jgi:hypothetical protein
MISSSSKARQKDEGRSARLKSLLEHVDKLPKKTVTYCEVAPEGRGCAKNPAKAFTPGLVLKKI